VTEHINYFAWLVVTKVKSIQMIISIFKPLQYNFQDAEGHEHVAHHESGAEHGPGIDWIYKRLNLKS
jgi:hypothetical protein